MSEPAPVLAVVGGGQLARMMAQPAIALGLPLRLLAEAEGVSAAQVIPDHRVGDHRDLALVLEALPGVAERLTASGANAFALGVVAERGRHRLAALHRRAERAVRRLA